MDHIVFTFASTRDAIAAERACLGKKINCQAIPLPREISADCGIALQIRSCDKEHVAMVLSDSNIKFSIYDNISRRLPELLP
jgi:hypothetical protein